MILHRVAAACVLVLVGPSAGAAEPSRKIQIRYDFTRQSPEALEVWMNCEDDATWETCPTNGQDDSTKKRRGPAASGFLLKATDRVLLVVLWRSATETRSEIAYAVS